VAEPNVGSILEELARDAQVLTLLNRHRGDEFQSLWKQDPQLYRAFARKLNSQGHPGPALEVATVGLRTHANDPDLLYSRALALARSDNVTRAAAFVKELLDTNPPEPLRVEALSLAGRLCKDRYARLPTADVGRRAALACESFLYYEKAYRIGGDPFPGINAATMALLAGDADTARTFACQVHATATQRIEQPGKENDFWLLATLGEAELHRKDFVAARGRYRQAMRVPGRRDGDIAAMRRQVRLLRDKLPIPDDLLAVFHIGRCVLFAGHTIDHPGDLAAGLAPFRFPADERLEQAVAWAIQHEIDKLDATIGYCVPSSGAGILFGELMRKKGAELHVILPFALDDFYKTRVDYGLPGMAHWRDRCARLLERPEAVHYATTEDHLDDQVLFDFADTFLQGLGRARGDQIGVEPVALVVIDPATRDKPGSTTGFVKRWEAATNRKVREIDLADLRDRLDLTAPPPPSAPAIPPIPERKQKREVRAMLFADVKNFSKLPEKQAPDFFLKFLSLVEAALKAGTEPLFGNTWGDGLYVVFDDVVPCADFALRFLESLEAVDWSALGLPKDSGVRIGMHAGPVFRGHDPIINRDNFFGSHVSRAARIEPVTVPGCAFVSEQFAAALAMTPGHDFLCEYLGIHELAKDYDRCPLYRLTRR
jgi:class 3 adenylate cyclase